MNRGYRSRMGVGRTILLAVVGPFLVYYAFLGHVAYRHFVETPCPIEVQVGPSKCQVMSNLPSYYKGNKFNRNPSSNLNESNRTKFNPFPGFSL